MAKKVHARRTPGGVKPGRENRSHSPAAKCLGINEDTLYGWRECARHRRTITNGVGKILTSEESKAENARLSKELRQSQHDNEILQKALGFLRKNRRHP